MGANQSQDSQVIFRVLPSEEKFQNLFKDEKLVKELGYTMKLNLEEHYGLQNQVKNKVQSIFKELENIQIILEYQQIKYVFKVTEKELDRIVEMIEFIQIAHQDFRKFMKREKKFKKELNKLVLNAQENQQQQSELEQNDLDFSKLVIISKPSINKEENLQQFEEQKSEISQTVSTTNNNEDQICCLCLDNKIQLVFPCYHSYCQECSNQWTIEKNQQNCPLCRKDFMKHYGSQGNFQKEIFYLESGNNHLEQLQNLKEDLASVLRDKNKLIPSSISNVSDLLTKSRLRFLYQKFNKKKVLQKLSELEDVDNREEQKNDDSDDQDDDLSSSDDEGQNNNNDENIQFNDFELQQ